jgi:phosphate uptake regulator
MRGCHNLEHAAEWVINICERVVFTVTGRLVEMDVEEGETSCIESLG